MGALPFTVVFVIPAMAFAGALAGGLYNLAAPIFVFGMVPALDLVMGTNASNPSVADEPALEEALGYRWVTWAVVPVNVALVAFGVAWSLRPERTAIEVVLLAISVGISSGGLGITVAHELVHRRERHERVLGYLLLWVVGYMHWGIEHVGGHHRNVATPDDPATARRAESFWTFLPRTVSGGFADAWRIEKARTRLRGGLRRNRVLGFVAVEIALVVAIGAVLGPVALAFFLAQAAVAVGLLEAVNYLEHWGLRRERRADGTWERTGPRHSWNADQRLTNWLLFNLQRHSDHHADSSRRYQMLRSFEESPHLPSGYAGMVLLALVPPLWRRVMEPRLAAWEREAAVSSPTSQM